MSVESLGESMEDKEMVAYYDKESKKMRLLKYANTDITYCIKDCNNKCWRHADNYNLEENVLYCFTEECINKEGVKNEGN